ncbi:hypothetical protein [Enemella sp. A6]|uniref:hypothetical protein n=1 Tax=Enemella sp. A6 TaxID=3440152 RepID=UPI003EBD5DF8
MGLFDKFKQAKQAMTASNMKAGWSAGMSSAAAQMANPMAAAGNVSKLQAYGEELKRIQSVGLRGTGVVRSLTPVPGAEKLDPGLDWMVVQTEIALPGRPPYLAENNQLVASVTAHLYAPGTQHNVAVDPADPNKYAFTE